VHIADLRQNQLKLAQRLLKVMTQSELAKTPGVPLKDSEVDFRRELEVIKHQLSKPAHFQGRVTELASIARIQDERVAESQALELDAENQQRISEFLEVQRQGLQYLTGVLQKDLRDLGTIAQGMEDFQKF